MNSAVMLNSSVLTSVRYNDRDRVLYLRFNDKGRTYKYFEVPKTEYEWLLEAPSAGQYFSRFIKNKYRCERQGSLFAGRS